MYEWSHSMMQSIRNHEESARDKYSSQRHRKHKSLTSKYQNETSICSYGICVSHTLQRHRNVKSTNQCPPPSTSVRDSDKHTSAITCYTMLAL